MVNKQEFGSVFLSTLVLVLAIAITASAQEKNGDLDPFVFWQEVHRVNKAWIQPSPKQLYYKVVCDVDTAQMIQHVWISDELLRWEMDQWTRSRSRKTAEFSLVAQGTREQYSTAWQEFATGPASYEVVPKPDLTEKPTIRKPTLAFRTGISWETGMQALARRKKLPRDAKVRYAESGEEIIVEIPECKRQANVGLGARHLNYGGFSFRLDNYRLYIHTADLVPIREEIRTDDGAEPWIVIDYAPEYLHLGEGKAPSRITCTINYRELTQTDGRPWIFEAEFQTVDDVWLVKKAETRFGDEINTTLEVSDVSTDFPEMSLFEIDQEDVAQESETETEDNLIENGSLEWKDGELAGWTIEKGAGGGRRTSVIRQGDDGSLEFSGDSSTQTWNFAGQTIPLAGGDFLEFTYTAKAADIKREARQFDNCYAGIWFLLRGENVGQAVFPVHQDQYMPETRIIRVPENATHGTVTFFLSKTGTLGIKDVGVRVLKPSDSFDVLVRQMDRYYSYFEHKGINWKELTDKYRTRAAEATDVAEFEKVVLEMLAEMKDGHIWIMKGKRRLSHYRPTDWKRNFDFGIVDADLQDVKKFGRLGLVAKTDDGFGYVRVISLQSTPEKMQELIDAVDAKFDTDGMIIDLRMNGGGSEDLGGMLAGLFCEQPVTYAKNRFRLNNNHDEFYEYKRGPVNPRDGEIYDKPVICLIGPGAVSSAEGTALMFDALPNVKTLGQPTRGATGNPAPVLLPNGIEVWFSRWVATDAEGVPIEDRGVQPDIVVEHGKGDPTWERARKEIGKRP